MIAAEFGAFRSPVAGALRPREGLRFRESRTAKQKHWRVFCVLKNAPTRQADSAHTSRRSKTSPFVGTQRFDRGLVPPRAGTALSRCSIARALVCTHKRAAILARSAEPDAADRVRASSGPYLLVSHSAAWRRRSAHHKASSFSERWCRVTTTLLSGGSCDSLSRSHAARGRLHDRDGRLLGRRRSRRRRLGACVPCRRGQCRTRAS